MKAAWLERYDKNAVHLTVGEREMPQVGAKDVLVRVSAAAVNPLDNMVAHGEVKHWAQTVSLTTKRKITPQFFQG